VEPNAHHLQNVGDVAMLQVALERLHHQWPNSTLDVITDAPAPLEALCPRARSIPAEGRRIWFRETLLGHRLHVMLPRELASRVRTKEDRFRRNRPITASRVMNARRALRRKRSAELHAFVEALATADVVVVSGAGAITDEFAPLAWTILDLVELASSRGTPTAMFGQGIGPIEDPALLEKANAVLPQVSVLGIRERLRGLPLLQSFGVAPERVFVTGDDAIDLAYRHGPAPEDASGIGVSVRVARYSGLEESVLDEIGATLMQAAERHRATLIGLPISQYPKERDASVIDRVLRSGVLTEPPLSAMDVITRTRECRIVVTGSYHAAVFALAQGIPAVGIAASEYYVSKFEGLIDQFGEGCWIVRVDPSNLRETLASAIDDAWNASSEVRRSLHDAAARQQEESLAAYRALLEVVDGAEDSASARRAG
jgi:polysaccharide pyruvyl transferase WcaK-like protein